MNVFIDAFSTEKYNLFSENIVLSELVMKLEYSAFLEIIENFKNFNIQNYNF